MEGMQPPLYGQQGSHLWWMQEYSTVMGGRQASLSFLLAHGGTYLHFTPPFVWPCQLWPSLVSGHISSWGSLSAGINGYWCHSLCHTYVFLLRSAATSHYLRSSPIFCGHSDGHPQQKSQLPVYPPQGSFAGRSLGDHLTIILLGCHLHFISYRGNLAWGGAGTPVPCMIDAYTQRNTNLWHATRRSQFWWRMQWLSMLVCHFVVNQCGTPLCGKPVLHGSNI